MVPCLTAQEKERHMMDAGSGVCGWLLNDDGDKNVAEQNEQHMQTRHVPETFCLCFLFSSFFSFFFFLAHGCDMRKNGPGDRHAPGGRRRGAL